MGRSANYEAKQSILPGKYLGGNLEYRFPPGKCLETPCLPGIQVSPWKTPIISPGICVRNQPTRSTPRGIPGIYLEKGHALGRPGNHLENTWKTPGKRQANTWCFPGEKLDSDALSRYFPWAFLGICLVKSWILDAAFRQ